MHLYDSWILRDLSAWLGSLAAGMCGPTCFRSRSNCTWYLELVWGESAKHLKSPLESLASSRFYWPFSTIRAYIDQIQRCLGCGPRDRSLCWSCRPQVDQIVYCVQNLHHHNMAYGGWSFAFAPYWNDNIPYYIDHPRTIDIGDEIGIDPLGEAYGVEGRPSM